MTDPSRGRDVTVVVPLYNGAQWIEATLDSIARQTHAPTQVIVVDDGSSDGGAELVRRHPVGATLLAQPNSGVAVARNRGLAHATGDWIVFLDQDDLWHPDHLRRALDWLAAHPGEQILVVGEIAFSVVGEIADLADADPLVGDWASVLVSERGELDQLIARTETTGTGAVEHHDAHAMLRGPLSVTTSFVAQPELLRLSGGFAPHARAMDDYWMLVNVARLTPIPRVDQPTVFYRVHVGATSRSTRLGLAFLSSAVALRWGGGIVPQSKAGDAALSGPLHRHLLGELLASPEYGDRSFRATVDELARLVWPPSGLGRMRRRALLARKLPWLRRIVRRARSVGTSGRGSKGSPVSRLSDDR